MMTGRAGCNDPSQLNSTKKLIRNSTHPVGLVSQGGDDQYPLMVNTKNIIYKKNKRISDRKTVGIQIGSLNVRSLVGEERLIELENALDEDNIEILDLPEICRQGEKMIQLKSGCTFYFYGENAG